MKSELADLDRCIGQLAAVDIAVLSVDELCEGVLGLQSSIEKLKGIQALLVRAGDERKVWKASGATSMADWLARKGKITKKDAKDQAKLGDLMDRRDDIADAVRDGEMSTGTANAIADAVTNPPKGATPTDVDDLIDSVKGADPEQARRKVEDFERNHRDSDPADNADRQYAKRAYSSAPQPDGMQKIIITLPRPHAEAFDKAVQHASGGFTDDDPRTAAQLLADGVINLTKAYASGTKRTAVRSRPTLIVHAQLSTLLGLDQLSGWTMAGSEIPAGQIRRLVLDADLQILISNGDEPLYLGRGVRLATDGQFLAVAARDGGCRFPGCCAPAEACELDHLREWLVQHGVTNVDELLLWCHAHHRFRHRSDVRLEGTVHDLWLVLPDGTRLACPPKPRPWAAAA